MRMDADFRDLLVIVGILVGVFSLIAVGLAAVGYFLDHSSTWVCDSTWTPQANTWTTSCGWR